MGYYLKKHWLINSAVVLLQVVWAGIAVLHNALLIVSAKQIFNMDLKGFVFWSLVDIAFWAVYIGVDYARTWVKSKAKLIMNNHIRQDMAETLLRQDYRTFHEKQSGEYLSMMTNDVKQISALGWDSVYSIISLIAQIIFSMISLAVLHWSLLAATLMMSTFILTIPNLLSKRAEKLGEDCAKQQAQAMDKMKDLLQGVDVLRFFDRKQRFKEKNLEASQQMEQSQHRMTYVQAIFGTGIDCVSLVSQTVLDFMMGFMAIKGIIIQTAWIGGGNYSSTVCNGLGAVSQLCVAIKSSKPYFAKITVHADAAPDRKNNDVRPMQKELSVEHLSFGYDDHEVIRDLTLSFKKGGKYALTGPSGCGKSTLLKILLGWLPDHGGKVKLDGEDIGSYTVEQLQQQMSYIEQNIYLFNSTIRDNITLGEEYSDELMDRAIKNSALISDLETMPLGLETPVGENGSNLSGGQKQRVAIARALIHNRSILLVDEGTSALDQKNADIVEQSLLENPDLTLILVSHHLSPERKKQFTKVYELEPVDALPSV